MPVPISNVPRRVVYAASGTGPYAFTFEILAAGDIAVYRDDTLLTITTDYTVTIATNGTGSITLVASPTGATQIAIVGNRTIARSTDFTTGGDFFANTLNDELDQQTIFAQQNAEGLARALQAPQTDPTTIDMTLPRAADRAGKYLAFDEDGNPQPGDTAVEVAAVYAIRDEIAAVSAIDSEIIALEAIDSNITTVAGIAANVTTVAGVAANVTTVAGISAAVSTVAADGSDIGAVAAISADVQAVADIAADVTAVAAADAADLAAVAAIGADVAVVAGISSDVSAVAAIDSAVATAASYVVDIETVAGISSEVQIVADRAADIETLATQPLAADIGFVANIDEDVSTVAGIAANVTTIAGIAADVSAVAAIDSDIETVADNLADVTNFADVYLGPKTSNPSTRNDASALVAGDLYFNTVASEMRVWTGSAWVAATSSPDTVSEVQFSATAGQTTYVFSDGYRVGFVYVWVNGVMLADADITATDGTNITFASALALNDEVRIISFKAVGSLIVADIGDLTATAAELNVLDGITASTAELNFTDGVTSNIQTQLDAKLGSSAIGVSVQAYDADTAKTDVAQTFTASQRGTVTTDNDLSFDLSATNNFKCTPTGTGTLTFTNLTAGQSGFVLLVNSGGYTISAAATTKVSTTALATISAAGTYLLSYFTDGTNVFVVNSGALA